MSFDLGNLYSRQARTYFPPEVDLPFRSGHEDEDEARVMLSLKQVYIHLLPPTIYLKNERLFLDFVLLRSY